MAYLVFWLTYSFVWDGGEFVVLIGVPGVFMAFIFIGMVFGMVYLLDEIVHFVFGTVHIFITKMRTLFYNLRKKYAVWKQYSPTKSFGQKELQ